MWPVKESLFLSSEGSSFLSVLVLCMDKRDTAGCTIVSGSGNIPDRLGTAFPTVWELHSQLSGTGFPAVGNRSTDAVAKYDGTPHASICADRDKHVNNKLGI